MSLDSLRITVKLPPVGQATECSIVVPLSSIGATYLDESQNGAIISQFAAQAVQDIIALNHPTTSSLKRTVSESPTNATETDKNAARNVACIAEESTKAERPKRRNIMIDVRTLTGKIVVLEAPRHAKVSKLKELYEEKEGIPPVTQRLIYGGKQLSDDKTLEEVRFPKFSSDSQLILDKAGLEDSSTLHMVLACKGS